MSPPACTSTRTVPAGSCAAAPRPRRGAALPTPGGTTPPCPGDEVTQARRDPPRAWSPEARPGFRRSGAPPGLTVCVGVALPPVPGEGDEAANHVGGQPGGARDVPQGRVFVLGMPEVQRAHVRFPACQYPPARTWGPAEPVLDHTESAGGNALAVLELSQRSLGYPGRFGKGPPVPHA